MGGYIENLKLWVVDAHIYIYTHIYDSHVRMFRTHSRSHNFYDMVVMLNPQTSVAIVLCGAISLHFAWNACM